GAGPALGELAAATGAVTSTTALGRGIFPEARYDIGVSGGFGAPGAMELVRSADVAVVVGAGMNQFTMRFGELFAPHTAVWQIDTAPSATNARVGGFVRADARLAAEALTAALPALEGATQPWRESIDASALRAQVSAPELAEDELLDPRAAAARLAELLPEDRVVVSDGGHFIAWANMYWPVAAPHRMAMVGTAYQSIGLGWPSVPGAARANPDSTIVLTTGDGGGVMALADLDSAVRTAGGRGLAVVWNDAAYGAEVNLYGLKGLAAEPMLIDRIDFAAYGAAAGAEGVVVRRLEDLERLRTWSQEDPAQRSFLVLDLQISRTVIAPYQEEVIRVNS
ncbi:MAG: thiamine pyrophosphate-dependent enzyme, partial [Brachybacterium sp.]|nr:thiamine pyrophosphate-dependent enzyme [Brachybacterium sp.]